MFVGFGVIVLCIIIDSLLHNFDSPLTSENKMVEFLQVWQILASSLSDVDI